MVTEIGITVSKLSSWCNFSEYIVFCVFYTLSSSRTPGISGTKVDSLVIFGNNVPKTRKIHIINVNVTNVSISFKWISADQHVHIVMKDIKKWHCCISFGGLELQWLEFCPHNNSHLLTGTFLFGVCVFDLCLCWVSHTVQRPTHYIN